MLRSRIGLSPSALVRRGLAADAWDRWSKNYGAWFRDAYEVASPDLERIAGEAAPAGELPPPPGL